MELWDSDIRTGPCSTTPAPMAGLHVSPRAQLGPSGLRRAGQLSRRPRRERTAHPTPHEGPSRQVDTLGAAPTQSELGPTFHLLQAVTDTVPATPLGRWHSLPTPCQQPASGTGGNRLLQGLFPEPFSFHATLALAAISASCPLR